MSFFRVSFVIKSYAKAELNERVKVSLDENLFEREHLSERLNDDRCCEAEEEPECD
jgi:hypothetical protein